MYITLRNDFHSTETRVRAEVGDILSPRVLRRVDRDLCGLTDCGCGGIRGPQQAPDGRRIEVEEAHDQEGQTAARIVLHWKDTYDLEAIREEMEQDTEATR